MTGQEGFDVVASLIDYFKVHILKVQNKIAVALFLPYIRTSDAMLDTAT